jgi:hypothetical protein
MAVLVVACAFARCPDVRAGEPFTDESMILAVTREDPTNLLKTRRLKKELSVSEVIGVLTTFPKVTREQYLTYDHQIGAGGTVTLKGGKTYSWEIEPGYAGRVTAPGGETTYLLAPGLKVAPEEAGNPPPEKRGRKQGLLGRDLDFDRGVPASDRKVEVVPGRQVTRSQNRLVLAVKVTNNSPDAVRTTLAHEWHGGLWPPTGLYASVTAAGERKDSAFVPVYLAGEESKAPEATTLTAGQATELRLRMDWPGTGSVPARRLIESAGTYRVQVLLVFDVAGKKQYVTSPPTKVELPAD